MQKWEVNTIVINVCGTGIFSGLNPYSIWQRDKKTDACEWDKITKACNEGWELVSVTPLEQSSSSGSYTSWVLYSFKRPIEDPPNIPKIDE